MTGAVYVEVRASAIDREAEEIETNALPSVELLASARAALRRVEGAADELAEEPGERRREASATMEAARRDVDRELASEFATNLYPGERDLQSAALAALGDLDGVLARLREAVARGDAEGVVFARHEVRNGIERADSAIERILFLNATQGRADASRIAIIRAGSVRTMLALNLACVLFSIVAAIVATRATRRQRAVELEQSELLEQRALELERFASRVAHDILSPLSALHFTLGTLERNAAKGLPIAEPIERATACLRRSQSLVDGLMDFARSGASGHGGRANLRAALDGVLEEARAMPGSIEFVVEGVDDDLFLACAPGVLVSILSNLVRNAAKYIADMPEKRVTIRAASRAAAIRVEVEDTGPGLAPGLEPHVFEPYVRAPDNAKPGLGLGLATVKRFVEAYRGRVGVASSADRGSLFWFELPRAGGATSR